MAAPDVAVEVTDTGTGVALSFTTRDGDVGDLRRRVQDMAQRYGQCDGHRGMMWHRMDGRGMGPDRGRGPGSMPGQGMHGMGRGRGAGPMPAVETGVEQQDGGARIVLTPKDPTQLQALRQHVRMQQQHMQSGECWMLRTEGASSAADEPSVP
jgi:hypothetical protein